MECPSLFSYVLLFFLVSSYILLPPQTFSYSQGSCIGSAIERVIAVSAAI